MQSKKGHIVESAIDIVVEEMERSIDRTISRWDENLLSMVSDGGWNIWFYVGVPTLTQVRKMW